MTFKVLLRRGKRELQTVKYIDTTSLWVEFFRLQGYYVAWDGFKQTFRNTIWKVQISKKPTFSDNLSVPSSKVKMPKESFLDILKLEDGTDR
jgi:hypothetical protein